MRKVVLERLESGVQGTFGRIQLPGFALYTGELPWVHNLPNVSCIPPGLYLAEWVISPRFRRFMYGVRPVESRSGIRVHPANLMGNVSLGYRSQLNGCIALGEKLGWIDRQKAVLLSVPAVRRMEEAMKRETFELEIIDGAA